MNGVTDSSLSVSVSSTPATVSSISHPRVSPVLKQLITINIDGGFSGTLSAEDLTVTLIDTNTTRALRKAINVVEVDATLKTITVKYGGIYSGDYNIEVYSATYGAFDSTGVLLTAIG